MLNKCYLLFVLNVILCPCFVRCSPLGKIEAKDIQVPQVNIKDIFPIIQFDEKDAFNQLISILERMPWYKKNGYNVPIPTHEAFKDLGENPEKIATIDKEKYYKIFVSGVYKPIDLIPVQACIDENAQCLRTVIERFNLLNKQWGFKIFPQYKIQLTLYSPGGRYWADLGTIELKVDQRGLRQGTFRTIVHEMVHIGIEAIIVQKFHLSHWEKEGLVDTICSLYFSDLLPDYQMQNSGDTRIKEFITDKAMIVDDLPGTISKYILKYPRENL